MSEYSILIVEDEKVVREGVARTIASYEKFVVHTASSAEEALLIMFSRPIDALFLDIQLPEMTGLDMLYQLRNIGYDDLIVIIMSGHTEFDYAHTAIELKVNNYILKPITPPKLREVAKHLLITLGNQEKEKIDRVNLLQLMEASKPLLKQAFLTDLLESKLSNENLLQKSIFLEIDLISPSYRIIIINPQFNSNENELELRLTMERISLVLNDFDWQYPSISFLHGTNLFLILQMLGKSQTPEREDFTNLRGLVNKVRRGAQVGIVMGIGEWVSSLDTVITSYQQASSALMADRGRSFYSINPCLYYREITATLNVGEGFVLDKALIRNTLQELNEEEIPRVIDEIITKDGDMALIETFNGVSYYLHCLIQLLIKYQPRENSQLIKYLTTMFRVLSRSTSFEYKKELIELTKKVFDEIKSAHSNFDTSLVATIKKYIHEEYRSDMSITILANTINYSPNYLGALFKKKTGMSIHDYWHTTRMEHAKTLLSETTLYVFEIAEQIGYNDPYYFSSLFKRFVGVSPTHYRN